MDASSNNKRSYRTCLLALGGFCIAIIYAGLGSIPLLSLNEARRAVPIEVMHATGDWLLPQMNGELYLAKPPVFYWFAAAISALADRINEWTLRLPSALAATSILAMVFYAARRYFDRLTALVVVVVLLTCSTFVMFARRAEIEMLLAAFDTAALLSAYQFLVSGRRYFIYLSYAALGIAVLTKGPVALLFVSLPILLLAAKSERARMYVCSVSGWLLLLAIGLSWYAWVTSRLGLEVWLDVLRTDIAGKVYADHERDSAFTYFQAVLLDFLPWSIALIITPRRTWREWLRYPASRFLLLAAAVPLLAFTLMSQKHVKYLLPAYPAIAILVGMRVAQMTRDLRERYRNMAVMFSILLLAGYAVFYIAFERQVYAFRFSGLAEIQRVANRYPEVTLGGYKSIDMRTVYYAGRSIKLHAPNDIGAVGSSPQPQLLLFEKDAWLRDVDMTGWCELARITPYISRGQTAVLMANKAFCEKYPQASR